MCFVCILNTVVTDKDKMFKDKKIKYTKRPERKIIQGKRALYDRVVAKGSKGEMEGKTTVVASRVNPGEKKKRR